MISAPVILYPKTNWVAGDDNRYYSDSLFQMISGYIPISSGDYEDNTIFTVQYRYRIDRGGLVGTWSTFSETEIVVGATFEGVTSIPWSLNTSNVMELYAGDLVKFEFKAVKRSQVYSEVGIILDESTVEKLEAQIVESESITASSNAPTGFLNKNYRLSIKLMIPLDGVALNQNNAFAGCLFHLSLIPGGDSSGYVQINDVPVTTTDPTERKSEDQELSVYTDVVDGVTVTTTRTTTVVTEYYTLEFSKDTLTQMITAGKITNIFLSDGETLNPDQRYYFTATILSYDEALDQLVESPYTIELEAKFTYFYADYKPLPERRRGDVLFTISRDLMANNDLISVVPGSVVRDSLDPISLEFEKYYTVQDFVFSAMAVDTLATFDDTNGDGYSDSWDQNIRKKRLADALGITDQITLQLLIDEQFDKLGSNYNLTRNPAVKAIGTVTIYTTIKPTDDILISDGTTVTYPGDTDLGRVAVTFLTKGSKIITATNSELFYNPSKKRYEIEVDIEAVTAGADGNVPAGSITSITGVSSVIRVENSSPTQYGSDKESNSEYASRIKLAAISYDSGTEQGYLNSVYKLPNVIEARVEKVGDPLMMRDYDLEEQRHLGGKVDVYVKGVRISQVIDQIAFQYEYPTDVYGNKVGEQFEVINAQEFRFKCKNPKVGATSPIISVNKIRNVTRGRDYDMTDMQTVGDGDTLILARSVTNISIGLATFDVVEVDYRYLSSNKAVLTNQPVRDIVQVTDHLGTIIDTSKYRLVKLEDPLINGNSSISKDAIQFLFTEDDNITEFLSIVDEQHDMLLNTPARLLYKGVDIATIVVTDTETPSITYRKDVDYTITVGSEVLYTYLNLMPNGKIRHGTRVSVAYNASENFNITYTTNGLIADVQTKLDAMKHACADAVAKQAVGNAVDIAFRVIRKPGTDTRLLKSRIQTAVANHVTKLRMGEPFTQGALINVVQNVPGVKEFVMPMTRMAKRNGAFIPLDDLGQLTFEVYHRTVSGGLLSYRTINSVLTYRTSENGGDANLFRAVYEDKVALQMASTPAEVSGGKGRAYIQDDGRIIVSTMDGLPPHDKYYMVAYYVNYPADLSVIEDIATSEIEYLIVDDISLRNIEIVDEKVVKRGL